MTETIGTMVKSAVGIEVADAGEEFAAVGAGHLQVGDDDVVRLKRKRIEGRFRAEAEFHLPVAAVPAQQPLRPVQRLRVVVYDEYP